MVDLVFWWVGAAVCIGTGVALSVTLLSWAITDLILERFLSPVAAVRIMLYARRNGLDLWTGRKIDGEPSE